VKSVPETKPQRDCGAYGGHWFMKGLVHTYCIWCGWCKPKPPRKKRTL
jgi:hypothetical protein